MTDLVIDASVAASWYLPRQQTRRADALLDARGDGRWRAPHCFVYEVPNLLLREERKGILRKGEADRLSVEISRGLRIRIEPPPSERLRMIGLQLAREHRISLYDGLYLIVAIGFEAALASRDGRLLEAAKAMGCEVRDVRDHDN